MINRMARLEDAMYEVRGEIRSSTDRLIDALTKNTALMIARLFGHDDQLKNHDGRLSQLKNPPRQACRNCIWITPTCP